MSSEILLFVNKKKQKNFIRLRVESLGLSLSHWMKFFLLLFCSQKRRLPFLPKGLPA